VGGPLARAECDKLFDCCDSEERAAVLFSGANNAPQCLAFYGIFTALELAQLHNSASQGKVSLDGAALAGCIDQFEALTCEDYAKDKNTGCLGGIEGLVADGQACVSDSECISKYCSSDPMTGEGSCAQLPGAGEPCTDDCAEGYYCSQTCTAQKPVGEACAQTKECAEGRCFGAVGSKTCALICDGN
jgi:hypothetical protein